MIVLQEPSFPNTAEQRSPHQKGVHVRFDARLTEIPYKDFTVGSETEGPPRLAREWIDNPDIAQSLPRVTAEAI